MRSVSLANHPSTPAGPVERISVTVEKSSRGLVLLYGLSGSVDAIRVPPPELPERRDGLWRHTCFEAFLGAEGDPRYFEFNFAPSSAWAVYGFSGYRAGMEPVPVTDPPRIACGPHADGLTLRAEIDLGFLPGSFANLELRLGLAAVVEDRDSRIAYWAVRHPEGQADFHHRDGFALTLGGATLP